jgi:DNA-binding beta-propeller fold protein YncE
MKALKILCLIGLFSLFLFNACKKDDNDKPAVTPSLYFLDAGDEVMEQLMLDGTGVINKVKDLAGKPGVGIAYDSQNEKIYFSDFADDSTPNGKIWRMNIDTSGLEAIAQGIQDPYGVALDVDGGKVYWVDDMGNVSRANLDGSGAEHSLVNIPDGMMRAIAIDKENNKMYFYEVNEENLYVANLDGTNATVLIPGVYGYAILIDKINSKIYFDDQNTPALRRANLDGSNIVDIDNVDTRIYGIAIDNDNNKLYWAARDMGEIYEANLNGTEKDTIATGLTSPRGLFLLK